VLVIVPTYDERETLPVLLRRLAAAEPDAHVLIVDDASPDGTGELADGFARDDSRVHVLHGSGKGGLGAAYLRGFAWGLERGYDLLVEMDADGSHPPERLPELLAAARSGAGRVLVIGSRWVPGGKVENWPVGRHVLSRGGNLFVRASLGLRVRDATAGYRVFPAGMLRDILTTPVEARGYYFQVAMTVRALDAGYLVQEIPITFRERETGESKMSRAIVWEAMSRVGALGVRRRLAALLRRPRPGA
jgi:dolichol-phosphate mannosyltransferase